MQSKVDSSAEVQANERWKLVLEVEGLINKRFPLGSINRVDVATAHNFSDYALRAYLEAASNFIRLSDDYKIRTASSLAYITQTMFGGICGIVVNYAIGYLKPKYPNEAIECLFLTNHVILVLGRAMNTDSTNIDSWNKDTLLYDIWANKCYFACDFHKIRNEVPHIPFYARVVDDFTNKFIRIDIQKDHYLSGKPEVYVGKANDSFDQLMIQWVAEDQERLKRPSCKAPQASLHLATCIDSDHVKAFLTRISRHEGWKFSTRDSKATAWLECADQKQADIVFKTMEATKSLVVTSCKRSDNGIPVIKCTHFDIPGLDKLNQALTPKIESTVHHYRNTM